MSLIVVFILAIVAIFASTPAKLEACHDANILVNLIKKEHLYPVLIGKRINSTYTGCVNLKAEAHTSSMIVGAVIGTILLTLLAGPIGAAIGGAAMPGLAGAAAISHGLAMLGGGAIAVGGLGMSAGMITLAVTGGGMGAFVLSGNIDDTKCLQEALTLVQPKYTDMYCYDSECKHTWYSGMISGQVPSGDGILFDIAGRKSYSGVFADGLPEGCSW